MARSYKSVYSALIANIVIAITKFIAGYISNSTAMISEGIHSLVDTINEILLLFGIRQGNKPADDERPFGYGRELFFWAFVVSMLIFGLGGGISIYQGIVHIIHPEPPGDPLWNYIVIGLSIVFEGASFLIARKEFNKGRAQTPLWEGIIKSKDPSSFVTLIEDGAAVAGLLIVLVCVFLGHQFSLPYLDGVGSLLVGLLLVGVSLVSARESRSLMMGEGVSDETRRRIAEVIAGDADSIGLSKQFSMYVSPDAVVLLLTITFKPLHAKQLEEALHRIRAAIKKEFRTIRYIIIQPEFEEEIL